MLPLLIGCGSVDWCLRFNLDCKIETPPRTFVDSDGDVWPDDEDCEPLNPAVYPNARESCDGVDNDCDGVIDEGVSTIHYRDADDDGFADEDQSILVCQGLPSPDGWIPDPSVWDCNDSAASTHPDADEICDEADNDCDGDVDEGAKAIFYLDDDNDNYGDPAQSVLGCFAEDGYTLDSTDCDDTTATTYPGADELCDDVDADCDGRTADCATDLGGARWWAEQEDELAGWSVSGAGDVDGDGYDDLLVGAEGWISPEGATNTGAAYLITGLTSGAFPDASVMLTGVSGSDYTGYSVAPAGDLDGDGYGDVLIGASNGGEDGQGMAWLVMGPVTASADLGAVGSALLGGEAGSYAGVSVAAAGGQLLVSAPYSDEASTNAGLIYLADVPDTDAQLADISVTYTGSDAGLAGWSIDAAGDTDGDGIEEFLVGAPSRGSSAGRVWLTPLGSGGELDDTARRIIDGGEGDYLGASVAGVGDVDGDGLDDILLGAYGDTGGGINAGLAALLPGSTTASGSLSIDAAPTRMLGDEGDFAGYAVSGAGDVDGDGLADLLVGAQRSDVGASAGGATWLITAPDVGVVSLSAAVRGLVGADGERTGWAVSGAGDVDGDGLSDILIGAPYADSGAPDGGAAWLVLGSEL